MTIKDTEKLIKAINERMAVYERKNLTESIVYRRLQDSIRIMDLPSKEIREGVYRISRTKEAIARLSEESQSLSRLNLIGGLKEEKKKAREALKKKGEKPTEKSILEKSILENIRNYGKLEKWADDNLSSLYELENTIAEAGKLSQAFDEGLRSRSYDDIFSMIDSFESARDKWVAEANVSKLAQASATPILQSFGNNIKY